MNWNISLQFKTTDGWRQNNQTVFGNMSIESDDNTDVAKYGPDHIKKGSYNIVKYNYGRQAGNYSEIERKTVLIVDSTTSFIMMSSEIDITIVSNHIGPILEVRNLTDFIHFNAEFVGYYYDYMQSIDTPRRDIANGDMFIKVFNSIGIRMPTIDMSFKQLLTKNQSYYEINYGTSDRFSNILIDIAECINIEQKTDGTFNITLIRPIKITKTVSYDNVIYTMIIEIGTPKNVTWSILTYFQASRKFFRDGNGDNRALGYTRSIFTNLVKFDSVDSKVLINKNEYFHSEPTPKQDDFTIINFSPW